MQDTYQNPGDFKTKKSSKVIVAKNLIKTSVRIDAHGNEVTVSGLEDLKKLRAKRLGLR